MFDKYDFIEVDGIDTGHELRLFSLSTCGYCKKAISFLNESGIRYSHIVIDELPIETKSEIKGIFKQRFGQKMAFPTLIIDKDDFLVGFIKLAWENRFKELS